MLLAGATGYVGMRLTLRRSVKHTTEIVQGDVLEVVRDTRALDAFPIRPMGIRQAIQQALA